MNVTTVLTAASAARPALLHAIVGETQNKWGSLVYRAACGVSLNVPSRSVPELPVVTCPKCLAR